MRERRKRESLNSWRTTCSATMLFCGLVASPLAAANFLVYNTTDQVDIAPGDGTCDADPSPPGITCTLRAAVMEANALPGTDIIRVNAGTYNLTLAESGSATGGDLDVTETLTIENAGVAPIIDGQATFRIFETGAAAVNLTVRGVRLRNGSADYGGCLRATGDLTLERSEVTGCEATDSGGGVFVNGGALTVNDAWIHGNTSGTTGIGGGITFFANLVTPEPARLARVTLEGNTAYRGGAISAAGEMNLINVTIRGNSAVDIGGGIWATGAGRMSNVTLVHNVCDTDNDGDSGGGISKPTPGVWVIENSVLARNSCRTATPLWQDCAGDFDSAGYNLVGIGTDCTGFTATGDEVGAGPGSIDPLLAPLAQNGGWAPTLLPLPASPLLQAGNPAGCSYDPDGTGPGGGLLLNRDQRVAVRPAGGRCERGAVELGPFFLDGFESQSTARWSAAVF